METVQARQRLECGGGQIRPAGADCEASMWAINLRKGEVVFATWFWFSGKFPSN
jgi:hypothetical protein